MDADEHEPEDGPAAADDLDRLADRVAARLDPGAYGDKVLLTRRQLAAIAGGGLSAGALTALGFGQSEAQSAVGQVGTSSSPVDVFGATVDSGTYEVDNEQALMSVAVSGSVQLSSGSATVDTGLSATSATFYLALGVDDPGADVDLAGKLFWDDSAGTYKITIEEVSTSVGNPTANYDVLRVK